MFMKWLFPGLYSFSFAAADKGGGGGKTKTDTDKTEEEEDAGADETSEEEDDGKDGPTLEELKALLAETKANLSKANKEAADRRRKLEVLEKDADEKKKADMTETERLKAEKEAAEAKAEETAKTNRTLRLERSFDTVVRSEKIVFANEKARENVFKLLDLEEVGDDGAGMKDQLKVIQKEQAYFFKTPEADDIDATEKGKGNRAASTEEIVKKKRRDYPSI